MDAVMKEIIYFAISYVAILLGGLFFFNWLSQGFLWAIIKTKMSRGRKILIIMHSPIRHYPAYGWIEGQQFKWYDRETKLKDKNKTPKSVAVQEGMFYRLFGIDMTEIDEATNAIISKNGEGLSGFDAILQENLIIQALQKPTDQNTTLVVILEIVIIVLLMIVAGICVVILQKTNLIQVTLPTLCRAAADTVQVIK